MENCSLCSQMKAYLTLMSSPPIVRKKPGPFSGFHFLHELPSIPCVILQVQLHRFFLRGQRL